MSSEGPGPWIAEGVGLSSGLSLPHLCTTSCLGVPDPPTFLPTQSPHAAQDASYEPSPRCS